MSEQPADRLGPFGSTRMPTGAKGKMCEQASLLLYGKVLVGASVKLLEPYSLISLWERWGN